LCFNIGEKMFLLTSPDEIPCNVTFKVTSEKFEELLSKEGFSKDVYLGRYHWIHIDDIGRLNKTEWEELVSTSYGLVLEKIGGRKRKELGV
jgi:predicted DNA-binding protein (MmcQ/YjbR family)